MGGKGDNSPGWARNSRTFVRQPNRKDGLGKFHHNFRSFGFFFRLAVLLLVLLVQLSCGRGNRERRILIWHSLRPVERIILRQQLRRFAEHYPGWTFDELFYPPEQARTSFIISALGGSGPELFWGASDNIGPFVELGVIRPLEDLFEPEFLERFVREPVPANTWYLGHLYQIADRIGNHLCLVYNKKLVKTPPQTIRELIEMGKELTYDADGDGKIDHYALAWNYTEPFFVVPFIAGYGGWIMDDQYRPTLNTEAVRKAAQLIFDLAHTHRIIPKECDYEIANALFKDGYAAMIINGPWSWATYLENGIDIGITRIPRIDETGLWPAPMVSPLGYSVNSNVRGEKLKMTVALLRFLTSPEVELAFARAGGNLPSRKEAYHDPFIQESELIQSSLYQLQVGRLMPVVPELRWIWDAMRPAYQAIFTGELSPAQAAERMQTLAEQLIAENRR